MENIVRLSLILIFLADLVSAQQIINNLQVQTLTVTGNVTSTGGSLTVTGTGDSYVRVNGAVAGTGGVRLGSNSGTQFWDVRATGGSSHFTIYDVTAGAARLDIDLSGNVTGTHLQNLGSADSPSFSGLTATGGSVTVTGTGDSYVRVNGAVAGTGGVRLGSNSGTHFWDVRATGGTSHFTVYDVTAGAARLDIDLSGNVTGTHLQNLGSADSPTFSSISVGSCTGCGGGSSYSAGSGISISGGVISNTGIVSLTGGTGISISGGTVAVTGFGAPYATGSKYFGSLSGASGTLATYGNTIDSYDASGAYIGRIPII